MPEVTAYTSTKNRYFTTLPLLVQAIAMQTTPPKKFIIYDDGAGKDLRSETVYENLFRLLDAVGIKWVVQFGQGKGQVLNHQKALDDCETEWLWRLDDDNIPEPNCLAELLHTAYVWKNVGAVGGLVLHPTYMIPMPTHASNKIEDVFTFPTIQWYRHTKTSQVDHLYSTFLFRKEAGKHGYCKELSPVGHREETIFTYEMKRKGWDLLVTPSAVTWHLREAKGGIREGTRREMWEHDDAVFSFMMKAYGVQEPKLIVLDSGLGDHLAFKNILPELQEKHKRVIIAVCYPDVFKHENVELISIVDAKQMLGEGMEKHNIYKWMWDNKWDTSIVEAYRRMYGC